MPNVKLNLFSGDAEPGGEVVREGGEAAAGELCAPPRRAGPCGARAVRRPTRRRPRPDRPRLRVAGRCLWGQPRRGSRRARQGAGPKRGGGGGQK